MGRVGRRTARVQVTSRLTWTFSASAQLGRSRATGSRLPAPASAAGRRVCLGLLWRALRAARPRPAAPSAPVRAARVRRGRRR
ncbi:MULTISPECIES: hypothetical protein [Streptomyces]|uniref:hypothetical protein n=1 Tax=Streptomyces TaxID=1883 RepID=UPI00211A040E|nr:hypothetical protein [Streptomyces hilarionis]MCQ9129690.1 hypothetical protein [Streptomyces hilarionis]